MLSLLLLLSAPVDATPIDPTLRPPKPTSYTRLSLMPAGAPQDLEIAPDVEVSTEFFAVSLSAGRVPVDVVRINYHLIGDTALCDSGREHMVQVRKEVGVTGDAAPWQGYPVAASADLPDRWVTVTLSEPIHLEPGERMDVAVQLVRHNELSMCLAASSAAPLHAGRQFIASPLVVPYDWMSFEEVGIEGTVEIGAVGRPSLRR